jgi:hypothetical protein
MRKFHQLFLVAIALALVIMGNSVIAAGPGNHIAVRLLGTDVAYDGAALFEAYGIPANGSVCWDFDMLDIKTGNSIGDVTDCAKIVGVVGGAPGDPATGYALIGTTFFHFQGGTVVSEVNTTVMPITHGSPLFSHITGAVPLEGTNNVLYGDGKFKSATGTVRFSGGGDLSTFFDDGIIYIDCLFTLDIKVGN